MLKELFNDSWKFWLDRDAFALVWNVPEYAQDVTLPHDAMIEKKAHSESSNKGNTGFRDGDNYVYVKMFFAPEEYRDKTIMLNFEGVYMNTFVYVNGELAGKNPFGYSGFYIDLSGYLKYGQENEIRIQVRNSAMTNSRWYSGGGIYRDVYLLIADLAYVVPEGTQIRTEAADDALAVIQVTSGLKNRFYANADLRLETTIEDAGGNIVAEDNIPVVLFEQEERMMSQRIMIDEPKLWSEDTPVLYTCISRLYQGNQLVDASQADFGIRTLKLDAKRGLQVNGQTVKLRGACIHHDSGLLGAATYEDAQYRQIRILKEAGFNAVRMSHHPMAPAMLRACDALGVYVMDETFDMWNRCKSDFDYGLYFQEWWEKDVTAMVRKDFNHPSVIMYSVGNEIPEIGTDHGAKICHDLCAKIKYLDPDRYTLASINGVFAAGDAIGEIMGDLINEIGGAEETGGNVNNFLTMMDAHLDKIVVHKAITKRLDKACASTDIAGYNYMTARYEKDGRKYPNRVIVGSETYPPEIARNWALVGQCGHVIGDFTWTGWDYIGEAGVGVPAYNWGEGGFGAGFPCQLAYSGDIDITGFRRPASYFREIVFGLRQNPYITVQNPYQYGKPVIKTPWVISDSQSSWTWKDCEGKPVVVEVYSPGTEVELFLNGQSLGRKACGAGVGFRTFFDAVYEKGCLTAIAYDGDALLGQMTLITAEPVCELVLKPEPLTGGKLIYIPVEICDSQGNVAIYEDIELELEVSGGAAVIGFGSGDPKPVYNYNENKTKAFLGRAQIILKKVDDGAVVVTVRAQDGRSAELSLNI